MCEGQVLIEALRHNGVMSRSLLLLHPLSHLQRADHFTGNAHVRSNVCSLRGLEGLEYAGGKGLPPVCSMDDGLDAGHRHLAGAPLHHKSVQDSFFHGNGAINLTGTFRPVLRHVQLLLAILLMVGMGVGEVGCVLEVAVSGMRFLGDLVRIFVNGGSHLIGVRFRAQSELFVDFV